MNPVALKGMDDEWDILKRISEIIVNEHVQPESQLRSILSRVVSLFVPLKGVVDSGAGTTRH